MTALDRLTGFLGGDCSAAGIEDAAAHFDVSERTVEALLANSGAIPASWVSDYTQTRPPYSMGA
ncbi:MAG: hypothetical protein HYZ20_02930 [Burkholderiales bacterium]|nr:hypothetical protein [Burkholderiales bacterium]